MPLSSRKSRMIFLAMMVTVSMASGVVGGLLSEATYRSQIESAIENSDLAQRLTQQTSRSFAPQDLLADITPSLITLYSDTGDKTDKPTTPATLFDRVITDSQRIGFALAATNDGWLIAPTTPALDTLATVIAVDHQRGIYALEKRIDDKATGVSILKINATNLKPFVFGSMLEQTYPQDRYLVKDLATISAFTLTSPGYIAQSNAKDLTQTTDALRKVFNYRDVFTERGQPIVTDKGEVVGVTATKGIIPTQYLQSILAQVLRTSEVKRPSLGISYFDNAWLPVPIKDEKGAIIATGATVTTSATLPLEGGTTATLAVGDVIEAVNGEKIDKIRSLSEIVQQYKSGDILTLKVTRAGTAQTYAAVLK